MKIPGMILARSTKSVLIVVIAAPAVDVLAYFASVSRMTMMVTTMLMVTQMTTNLSLSLIEIKTLFHIEDFESSKFLLTRTH